MLDVDASLVEVRVAVLNGGPTNITLNVNRGKPFTVKGVGDGGNWQPALATTGAPTYDNGGPATNAFGPGKNAVTIQVGAALSYNVTVNVPVNSPTSLQFYLLLRNAGVAEWFLSCDGTVYDSSYGKPQGPTTKKIAPGSSIGRQSLS